jgi:hypothetical protein
MMTLPMKADQNQSASIGCRKMVVPGRQWNYISDVAQQGAFRARLRILPQPGPSLLAVPRRSDGPAQHRNNTDAAPFPLCDDYVMAAAYTAQTVAKPDGLHTSASQRRGFP